MKLKIEACPSCGYEGTGALQVTSNGHYTVKCDMCYAETKQYSSAAEAVNAWNGNNVNNELKPCPFCGSKDVKLKLSNDGCFYLIGCGNCGVMTTTAKFNNRFDAIKFWNTRSF